MSSTSDEHNEQVEWRGPYRLVPTNGQTITLRVETRGKTMSEQMNIEKINPHEWPMCLQAALVDEKTRKWNLHIAAGRIAKLEEERDTLKEQLAEARRERDEEVRKIIRGLVRETDGKTGHERAINVEVNFVLGVALDQIRKGPSAQQATDNDSWTAPDREEPGHTGDPIVTDAGMPSFVDVSRQDESDNDSTAPDGQGGEVGNVEQRINIQNIDTERIKLIRELNKAIGESDLNDYGFTGYGSYITNLKRQIQEERQKRIRVLRRVEDHFYHIREDRVYTPLQIARELRNMADTLTPPAGQDEIRARVLREAADALWKARVERKRDEHEPFDKYLARKAEAELCGCILLQLSKRRE